VAEEGAATVAASEEATVAASEEAKHAGFLGGHWDGWLLVLAALITAVVLGNLSGASPGGGARLGGSFAAGHVGGARAFAPGVAGQRFAQAHGHVGHVRHFARGRRFGPGFYDNDYGWCSYGYPYYTTSCYPGEYPLGY